MGVLFCFCLVPGSLSNNDGEGFKNVTKNVNLRRLKLDHAYSISFNSSSTKHDIRQFHLVVSVMHVNA